MLHILADPCANLGMSDIFPGSKRTYRHLNPENTFKIFPCKIWQQNFWGLFNYIPNAWNTIFKEISTFTSKSTLPEKTQ